MKEKRTYKGKSFISLASGVLVGALSALAVDNALKALKEKWMAESIAEKLSNLSLKFSHDLSQVKTGVNIDDSLSFDDAFLNARSYLGAGGVFNWNNERYSTYFSEEWDSMDASDKQSYNDAIKEIPEFALDANEIIDASDIEVFEVDSPNYESIQDNLMFDMGDVKVYENIDPETELPGFEESTSDNEVEMVEVEIDSTDAIEEIELEVEIAEDSNVVYVEVEESVDPDDTRREEIDSTDDDIFDDSDNADFDNEADIENLI